MSALGGVTSLLSVINGGGHPQPQRPYIVPLSVTDDSRLDSQGRYFQYWPEEITDNKQTNWETKNIPGLSHPIYQWISGGGREIGFTAIFTRDRALTSTEKGLLAAVAAASSLASSAIGSFSIAPTGTQYDPRNVDITSALAWLRQFLYPTYSNNPTERAKPPAKLILGFPGSRINANPVGQLTDDELVCIMTNCDINIGGWFADGTPRIAKVALQFNEVIQYEQRVKPVDSRSIAILGASGYTNTITTRDKNRT
jgi:hypothetical protein